MTLPLLMTAQQGSYGIARCAAGSLVPDWVHELNQAGGPIGLVHVTQAEDETSVICLQDRIPAEAEAARDWSVFRVDTLCDLDAPGVVAAAVQPVAEAGCGVLALSTYLRDYILIRRKERDRVLAAWLTAGHRVQEPAVGAVGAEVARDEPGLLLRRAVLADAPALAALHLQLWHQTYGAMAPAEIVLRFDLAGRQSYWAARLSRQDAADAVFIVERGGQLMGFCALQPQEHAGAMGDLQIKHLFLASGLRGQGMGRRLLDLARHQALRLDYAGLSLNVVEENRAAIAFYEGCGGCVSGRYCDPGPLWRSQNVVYRWPTG